MLVFADNFGLMSPYTAAQQPSPTSLGYGTAAYNGSVGHGRLIYSGGIPGYNMMYVTCEDDAPSPKDGTGRVHTFNTNLVTLGKGIGRMSDNALLVRGGLTYWGFSPIIPKTKRVVVGMWIAPSSPGQCNNSIHQASLLFKTNADSTGTGFWPPENASYYTNKFGFTFCGLNLMDWNQHDTEYDLQNLTTSSDKTPMRHMTVTFNLIGGTAWTVSVTNHSQTGYAYPSVPVSTMKFADASRPFFLEVLIDAEEAVIGKGFVKCSVNGQQIALIENLYTLDVQRLAGDMLCPNAYYRQVLFSISPDNYPYISTSWQVDGYYICDGSAGYQNDFLGPVEITNVFPVADAEINDWLTVLDGAHGEFDHNDCVDLEYYCRRTFDETSYLEADQHKMREMFKFDFPFDIRNTNLKAVQFIGSFEKQQSFAVTAAPRIYSTVRISGRDVEDSSSFTYFPSDNVHRCLVAPYSIAPTLATPWTWELLQNAEFGFTYYDGEYEDVTASIKSITGYTPSASLGGAELFDGNPATNIDSNGAPCQLVLDIPLGKIVDTIEVSHGTGSPSDIHGYLYVSGDNGNSWVTLAPDSFTLAGSGYGIAPSTAYIARYRVRVPYPVTNILLGAYGYAGYWRCIYYSMRILGAKKA